MYGCECFFVGNYFCGGKKTDIIEPAMKNGFCCILDTIKTIYHIVFYAYICHSNETAPHHHSACKPVQMSPVYPKMPQFIS